MHIHTHTHTQAHICTWDKTVRVVQSEGVRAEAFEVKLEQAAAAARETMRYTKFRPFILAIHCFTLEPRDGHQATFRMRTRPVLQSGPGFDVPKLRTHARTHARAKL
jgi:hypothetical protein